MKPSRDAPPLRIGRYEIRRELGRGTTGIVHEADDTVLGRAVALKTIRLDDVGKDERAGFEERFLAEARIAARLSHPGIVVVHDVGRDTETGTLYMALERLVGETLAEKAAGARPLEWREVLRIVARVAEALHHAHTQGVVHRDIKPANIMVLPSGDPKIMDFGIAKLDAAHLTSTGQVFGTPLFMAPEQALGQAVDGRTDVFSLGSTAYTLLTGRAPFQDQSIPRILTRVAYQDPAPSSTIVSGLPEDVDYVLARAMAKSPADRYATARAMAEDIEDILAARAPRHRAGWTMPPRAESTLIGREGELDVVFPPPPAKQTRRPARRRAFLLVLLCVALAALYFRRNPKDWDFWRGEWPRVLDRVRDVLEGSPVPPASSGFKESVPPPEVAPSAPEPATSPQPAESPLPSPSAEAAALPTPGSEAVPTPPTPTPSP